MLLSRPAAAAAARCAAAHRFCLRRLVPRPVGCRLLAPARLCAARAAGARAAASASAPAPAKQQPPAAPPPPQQQQRDGYRLPPKEIAEVVDHPVQPSLSFSPDRRRVLELFRPPPLPPISELARPELKLAGLRIDPAHHSRSRMGHHTGFAVAPFDEHSTVLPLEGGGQTHLSGVPPGARLNYVTWSPDSARLAFTVRSGGGPGDPPRAPLQLWVADADTLAARPLLARPLNVVFDDYDWVDAGTIVAAVLPAGLGPPPEAPPLPPGPKIEDNSAGATSQARTVPDLLQSAHDEALFDHYGTSELVLVDVASGEARPLGPPRVYTAVAPSPDGRYLLVSWLERPYSYAVPCGRFPKRVQLWRRDGSLVRELAALPLADDIPIAFDSCRRGPRAIGWRDDKPAEVHWTEAQDFGDPAVAASPRDVVYVLPADAAAADPAAPPRALAGTDARCGGVAWGGPDLALLYESEWKTRRSRVWTLRPADLEAAAAAGTTPDKQLLFDRNYEDSYGDPGVPMVRRTALGTYVLARLAGGGRRLLLQGAGASPEGNRPFLDVLDVDAGAGAPPARLWQSSPPYFESVSSLLAEPGDAPLQLEGLRVLATRETAEDNPQYHIMTLPAGGGAPPAERVISRFPHPYPTLRGIQKQIVRYARADGVDLTATLYTPPGYDAGRDGPLPALLWAYPREFKSRDAAGQLRRSPHEFSGVGSLSPLLWLARRYAILDGPSMPIVAEGDAEPNDTYVEQLTASARAAVDELLRRGVADPRRIAVGGHSYGAFMTANLLAHAGELFACGIARSGAYNRTLTPMGFQAEERTIWQAPETYARMSPFMQADKIKTPLLLVHGADDNNTGTFPMQSERFYAALKGHGCPARLVVLPHESHSYSARESVMHVLAEIDDWMERWMGAGAAGGNGNGAA